MINIAVLKITIQQGVGTDIVVFRMTANGSRLGEVVDFGKLSLKLITNV